MRFFRNVFLAVLCGGCFAATAGEDLLVNDFTGAIGNPELKVLSDPGLLYKPERRYHALDPSFPGFQTGWTTGSDIWRTPGLPANAIIFLVGVNDGKMQVLFGSAFDSARRRQVAPWVENIISEQFIPAVRAGNVEEAMRNSVAAFEASANGIKTNYDNLTWMLTCGALALGAFLFWEHREKRRANIYLAALMGAALIGMVGYAAMKIITFTAPGELRVTWQPDSAANAALAPEPGLPITLDDRQYAPAHYVVGGARDIAV